MPKRTLSLFFTRGISLQYWLESGLFEREKLIYEAHLLSGNLEFVYWMTYGADDLNLARSLKSEGRLHSSIIVCQMPSIFNVPRIGSWVYSLFMPFIHYKSLLSSDILKTNQMDGSWSAVISKMLYRKKLVLRTGYTLSQLENHLKRYSTIKIKIIERIESFCYHFSDISVVSSSHSKEYLIEKLNINPDKINVIDNYIDVDMFAYDKTVPKFKNRIIFVGRLSAEKNIYNLIDSIKESGFELDIYGRGDLRDDLEKYSLKKHANVTFKGVVANNELPAILNKYMYYVLPSLNEGMPKTLLEAMSCGLICIGTNVEGINEIIEHGVNGYLAKDTGVPALLKAFSEAISGDSQAVSDRAKEYINLYHSLNSVLQKECELYELVSGKL